VPWSSMAEALVRFAGDDHNGETFILLFVLLALAVLGVFGRGVDDRTIEFDLRTQPRVRAVALLAFATLILGTSISFVAGSAFDSRYASVMFPFFALLAAVGIIAAQARPGDVVAYCPDQIAPSASRLLAGMPGVTQRTFADRFGPTRVDWVDYVDRIAAANPADFARLVLRRAGPHTVWYVEATGFNHVEGKCEAVGAALMGARPHATRAVNQDDSIAEYMGLTIFRG